MFCIFKLLPQLKPEGEVMYRETISPKSLPSMFPVIKVVHKRREMIKKKIEKCI